MHEFTEAKRQLAHREETIYMVEQQREAQKETAAQARQRIFELTEEIQLLERALEDASARQYAKDVEYQLQATNAKVPSPLLLSTPLYSPLLLSTPECAIPVISSCPCASP